MIRAILIVSIIAAPLLTSRALAADLPGDTTTFGCLPKGAVISLLPAQGFSDVKRLGAQKGVTYFDAKLGNVWSASGSTVVPRRSGRGSARTLHSKG